MDADFRSEIENKTAAVLKTRAVAIDDGMPLAQIRGWDSVRFMKLLLLLETEWEVRFEAFEVARLETWGELLHLLFAKKNLSKP